MPRNIKGDRRCARPLLCPLPTGSFFWVALVVLASYVAYRSVKAYREGRMERVKPAGPRSESNSAPLE
jgi:hypothetical protein